MSKYIVYLAPIIAFVATAIGLLGPSRIPNATGVRAITPFGWASAAVAATSLCVALFSLYKRESDLAAARAEQDRIRTVVYAEIGDALNQLDNVLRYAVLMPLTTTPVVTSADAGEAASPAPQRKDASDIDLRSPETIQLLDRLYLGPSAHLRGPYIPSAVPFGTDVVRPSMTLIAEESARASQLIETAVQKYASKAMPVEIIESASAIVRAPFLKHLIALREAWAKRSAMEDSNNPRSLNFRFLNSGITGSYTKDYLQLLDAMDALRSALGKETRDRGR